MNRKPCKLSIFFANIWWLLTCISGLLLFLLASRNVKRVQVNTLLKILGQNTATDFGTTRRFDAIRSYEAYRNIPPSEYEHYIPYIEEIKAGKASVLTRSPVELLQPTSGSSHATKLIPYTQSLQREFKAAIDPWIASLYLSHPGLLFGRHYWSISPATPPAASRASTIRVGFANDAEYLGTIQRWVLHILFSVPPEISRVTDPDEFEYLTLLFLFRDKNLRVISIWHPSFLILLIKASPKHMPSIIRDIAAGAITFKSNVSAELQRAFSTRLSPDPARAAELSRIDTTLRDFPSQIWSDLRVISCWADGKSEPWVSELTRFFPSVTIQGKGLMATEGVVSFPLGKRGQRVCAIRSHFFEFVDTATGTIKTAWEVEKGKEYGVILTTGGGFYRYRLHDVVSVTGFFNQAPCLAFLSRDNLVSDLVGEKLNIRHIEESIINVEKEMGLRFLFAMVAPLPPGQAAGYGFYVQHPEGSDPDCQRLVHLMETELSRNFHYRHARRLSQLQPIRIFSIHDKAGTVYRRHLVQKGMKLGDIKFLALSCENGWSTEFDGEYLS